MQAVPRENRSSRFFDRLTRRAALLGGAAGIAAVATRQATAQDATPVTGPTPRTGAIPAVDASPAASEPASLLFVQHAGHSTLVPGEGGVHILTLGDVAAQSLYFSDRPNRITGSTPTAHFAHSFSQMFVDSPPNATLIGHVEQSSPKEEAVVLTLESVSYDQDAARLTYEVTLLAADEITDQRFERESLTVLDGPREYAEASLFIDNVVWPWEIEEQCTGDIIGSCDPTVTDCCEQTNCCDQTCSDLYGYRSIYATWVCDTSQPGVVSHYYTCTCSP